MKHMVVVLVWGGLILGLWLLLKPDGQRASQPAAAASGPPESAQAQSPASPSTPAAPAEPPSLPAPKAEPHGGVRQPSPVPAGPDKLAQAPERSEAPTLAEREGKLAYLYDAWASEQVNELVTDAAREHMGTQLSENEIVPTEHTLTCRANVCRARFAFPDVAAMRRLSKIRNPDSVDLVVGDPESDDSGPSIVIYFSPEGSKLPQAPGARLRTTAQRVRAIAV